MITFCNQNDKARLLILKFGERVQDTVNILPYQQRQNYAMLRQQLMETYAAPPDSGLWYAMLMNRKKLATESVAAYNTRDPASRWEAQHSFVTEGPLCTQCFSFWPLSRPPIVLRTKQERKPWRATASGYLL